MVTGNRLVSHLNAADSQQYEGGNRYSWMVANARAKFPQRLHFKLLSTLDTCTMC
jgi:hypothetical protein